MISKTKIAVLGMGGVGGYYGGKLAAQYSMSGNFEIIFIAKGENEKVIREKGLHLITHADDRFIHPDLVSNEAEKIGPLDILLCCTKAYDLGEALQSISQCIHENTIIIPLLNGVDNPERIEKLFPHTRTWSGCVYIVSRLIAPGTVHETGLSNSLFIGSEKASEADIKTIESVFTGAGIRAEGKKNILEALWTKFIFLCPLATLTSAFDAPIGVVLDTDSNQETLLKLMEEIDAISRAKGIQLPPDILGETLAKIHKLPYDTTSSMQNDFSRGRKTEIESLTGYVVRLGKEMHISTPLHEKFLTDLIQRKAH